MRTKDSIKNSLSSMVANFTAILFSFIAQAVFVRSLGVEYLGLNGLFNNILTLLSLFEVGVGSAIVYSIYKPISVNDVEKIKSLTWLYKKAYRIIALLFFVVGIALIPILPKLVKDVTVPINLNLIYILFLLSSIIDFFIADKRSLIIAYQKLYIINALHTVYYIFLYIGQIIILVLLKNYYLFLFIKIIAQLLEMMAIRAVAIRNYPFLLEKNISKLGEDEEKSIFEKVKALIFHKIGAVIVNGTDNIVISTYIGISAVGVYSNYYLILNAVNMLFGQVITSVTSSIGNLLVEDDFDKSFDVFKKMRFLNFWIACFTSISILLIIQPFITLWLGRQYLLDKIVVVALVFNFFQKMMRGTYSTFKDAGGIWKEDRFIPLVESLINIVFSIVLAKMIGMTGVFVGTIVSGLVLWFYSYPRFVYCKLFKRTIIQYLRETIGYISFFILLMIASLGFANFINNYFQLSLWGSLVVNTIWSLFVPNFILFIFFYRTENYKYFLQILKKII